MTTAKTAKRALPIFLLAGVVFLSLTTGCQKKCQQPSPTKFQYLRETQWRLVSTDNPGSAYKNLDRFTFQIWEFRVDFTGDVKRVEHNQQFDTPDLTYTWNVDTDQGLIRIKFSAPAADGGTDTTVVGTTDYYYTLSNELNMQDARRGYSYRFVPFQGVVDPDNNCTF